MAGKSHKESRQYMHQLTMHGRTLVKRRHRRIGVTLARSNTAHVMTKNDRNQADASSSQGQSPVTATSSRENDIKIHSAISSSEVQLPSLTVKSKEKRPKNEVASYSQVGLPVLLSAASGEEDVDNLNRDEVEKLPPARKQKSAAQHKKQKKNKKLVADGGTDLTGAGKRHEQSFPVELGTVTAVESHKFPLLQTGECQVMDVEHASDDVEGEASERQLCVVENDIEGRTDNVAQGHGFVCIEFDELAVLAMKGGRKVAIQGKILACVARGTAVVHGYELRREAGWRRLYSASTHSLLTITALRADVVTKLVDDLHLFSAAEKRKIATLTAGYDALVVLKNLSCHICDFVTSYDDYKHLFMPTCGGLYLSSVDVAVIDTDGAATGAQEVDFLVETEAFRSTADEFVRTAADGKAASVAVCGGLNSGKSTFCRYLINRALNSVPQLAYLECDLGQTEFTPPGCVSLTVVDQPLLGPPFTHLMPPASSVFVGQVSPASCTRFYFRALQHAYAAYLRRTPRLPLVVNTMGWMKDDGLSLLVDTLRLVEPNYVVQLVSSQPSQTRFLPMMTPEFLCQMPGLEFRRPASMKPSRKYRWIQLPSETPIHRIRDTRYNATSRRDLALLAYLGDIVHRTVAPQLSLRAMLPYRISWSDVAVHVCHESVPNSQIMYALNGLLVALCIADKEQLIDPKVPGCPKFLRVNTVCECVGFGIVRSISNTDRSIYLLTPVVPSVLENVNCLCRGAVNVPSCVVQTTELAACIEPYVDCLPKLPRVQRTRRRPSAARAAQDTSLVDAGDIDTTADCSTVEGATDVTVNGTIDDESLYVCDTADDV